jgi:Thiol-disulfide isomerase and thioredoxins
MIKKRLKVWLFRVSLLIIVCTFIGGTAGCSSSNSSSSPEELGLIEVEKEIEAPDFTIPTMEGGEITLSNLRGKPVVLNLWAIRCPPCRVELPYFDAVAKQNENEVTIVAVNIEDNISKVKQFFGNSEVSFIVAVDVNAQVASSYATGYIPTTVFIDSQGIIRYLKVGAFTSKKQLQDSIVKVGK